ncbi:MAG: transcription antitermination factor NusB [Lentisphaeria bacterium]|nr:transcription antitermination factor NusB [Lentisphaeria bacterium]
MNTESDFEHEAGDAAPEKHAPNDKKTHQTPFQPHQHFKRLGRELAMQYLFECDLRDSVTEPNTMEDFWAQAEESGEFTDPRVFRRAKAYAEILIGHVESSDDEITDYLGKFSEKWDVERMSAVDRNIMKVAVAEMLFCPEIPHIVSIDEAIEISKDFSDEKSGVFINGILNGIKNEIEKKPAGGKTE